MHGLHREALQAQDLAELAFVQGETAREAQGPPRQKDRLALAHVGVGKVDRDLEIVVGHGGVQDERPLAVDAQLEAIEEAGAPDIEAELALGHVGEIPTPVRHEKGLVVLEDELGQVGREGGREDIVMIADGDEVSGLGLAHALAAAWAARPR